MLTAYGPAVSHPRGMEIHILPIKEHQRAAGARLRQALDAAGVSQTAAAEIMAATKQSVNDYLAGRSYPSVYGMYRLTRATGITFDWVFLADWSALPARLLEKLQPRLAVAPMAELALDRQEVGTDAFRSTPVPETVTQPEPKRKGTRPRPAVDTGDKILSAPLPKPRRKQQA